MIIFYQLTDYLIPIKLEPILSHFGFSFFNLYYSFYGYYFAMFSLPSQKQSFPPLIAPHYSNLSTQPNKSLPVVFILSSSQALFRQWNSGQFKKVIQIQFLISEDL